MAEQIVVGYDGSQNADSALDWAIREAVASSAQLKVVMSIGRPLAVDPSLYGPYVEAIEEEAEKSAASAVARAREKGIEAVAVVERGDAAGVLIDESERAAALVLGKRGRRGVRGRVGSVSAAAAAHAKCPVILVPDRWEVSRHTDRNETDLYAGRTVAGVDELGADNPAVLVAARHAARHDLSLALVTVVPEPVKVPTASPELDQLVREQLTEPARALVHEVAQSVRKHHPQLEVETSVLFGTPAEQLVEVCRSAELVAVGSRGYGGFRGLLMGSVSQAVLNEGESPVMIVPTRRND